jgi:hypothetical protein
MLDADELVPRAFDRADDFIELRLHGGGVAILGVLDHEHHQEGHDRRRGVHHQLPGVRKGEQWAGKCPNHDATQRNDERQRLTCEARNTIGESGEQSIHPRPSGRFARIRTLAA